MEDKIFLHQFWIRHPDADAIPPFKALRTKRGDEASSRLMWYLTFLNDPEHEYVHKLPRKDRDELLKDYCEIKKGDLSSQLFKDADSWFQTNWLSAVKQTYAAFGDKIFDARNAIKTGVIFAPEDIETYKNALLSFKALVSEYEIAKNQFNSEVKSATTNKLFGTNKQVNPAADGSMFKRNE